MNSSKNLGETLFKATIFATTLFWTLVCSEEINTDLLVFFIPSIFIIFIICSLTILVTITPFFWLAKKDRNDKEIFKRYFPYYAIVAFVIVMDFIICSDFNEFTSIFFTTAFFTLMQSWIWMCKPRTKQTQTDD
ncbi:hypothetical protein [Polaribacter sp.]|uniref:hypothetical protein n=1 Tax=Polaribacter sp. TaxID=1920175 RepID=UPI003F6C8FAD